MKYLAKKQYIAIS